MKMTKLIIAAAIVCTAALSQAAALNWKASGDYITKDGAIQTAATADAGTFVLVYLGNGAADWDGAIVVNEGTVGYGSGKSGAYAKANGTYNWDYTSGAVSNGDIFGVMFKDGEGTLSKLQTADGVDIETTYTVSGLEIDTWGGAFTFASGNYTVGTGVPEPTSGLLLLVGGALLALRRKQK